MNSRKELRRNCSPIGHNNTKHFLCPIRSRYPPEFLEIARWEWVPRGSFASTWKLSSRLFFRLDWLPLGLRGWSNRFQILQPYTRYKSKRRYAYRNFAKYTCTYTSVKALGFGLILDSSLKLFCSSLVRSAKTLCTPLIWQVCHVEYQVIVHKLFGRVSAASPRTEKILLYCFEEFEPVR